jgi:hypothetical protein
MCVEDKNTNFGSVASFQEQNSFLVSDILILKSISAKTTRTWPANGKSNSVGIGVQHDRFWWGIWCDVSGACGTEGFRKKMYLEKGILELEVIN